LVCIFTLTIPHVGQIFRLRTRETEQEK
jgi:hypothetical protein